MQVIVLYGWRDAKLTCDVLSICLLYGVVMYSWKGK